MLDVQQLKVPGIPRDRLYTTQPVREGDGLSTGLREDDAISVSLSQVPSQVATTSQAASQQPRDMRSPRASSGVRRVDDAILSLVERMNVNTAVQNHLQTAEQEASRPLVAFCRWMGLDMAKLDEPLWNDFMDEAGGLVSKYKRAQSQLQSAAPPRPPPVSQPPMQPMQPMHPCIPSHLQCGHTVRLCMHHPPTDSSTLGRPPPAPPLTTSILDGDPMRLTCRPSTPAACDLPRPRTHCPCTRKQHPQHP